MSKYLTTIKHIAGGSGFSKRPTMFPKRTGISQPAITDSKNKTDEEATPFKNLKVTESSKKDINQKIEALDEIFIEDVSVIECKTDQQIDEFIYAPIMRNRKFVDQNETLNLNEVN